MVEIKLYDYFDDWYGMCGIGYGNLSAAVIVSQIEAAKDEDIIVKINSGGGLVFDGWAIYNALKAHPKKVKVSIDALAASIASIIAMAGEEIVMAKASMIMIHKPTIDPWYYGEMNADDLQREADALNKIQDVLTSIYTSKTNLEATVIDSMIDNETWLTAEQAVSMGFANSILEDKPTAVASDVFDHIFKNAPQNIRAYANNHLPKKNMTVSKETQDLLKQNNSLLDKMSKFFDKIFAVKNASVALEGDGSLYYDGDLAVGTAVFTDEALTTPASDGDHKLGDGRTLTVAAGAVTEIKEADASDDSSDDAENSEAMEALNTENSNLKNEVAELKKQIKATNEALSKIKDVKSKYVPEGREQDFGHTSDKKKENGEGRLNKTSLEEKRKNLKK